MPAWGERDFEILRRNRQGILIAEVGALLHNVGKMLPQFAARMREPGGEDFDDELIGGTLLQADEEALSRLEAARFRKRRLSARVRRTGEVVKASELAKLQWDTPIPLEAPFADRRYILGHLLDFQDQAWHPTMKNPTDYFVVFAGAAEATSRLTQLFGICHMQASGGDKRSLQREAKESETEQPEPEDQALEPQRASPWHGATVFGSEFEAEPNGRALGPITLAANDLLRGLDDVEVRKRCFEILKLEMGIAIADSHRPIHDVRVWDTGFAAAAFFKAAMAANLIEGNFVFPLQWRLVRFAVDSTGFCERAARIPDIKIRRELCDRLLDSVRYELEVETPLGNEVYRDEGGAAYVLPDIGDDDDGGTKLLSSISGLVRRAWERALRFREESGNIREDPAGDELGYELRASGAFALGPIGGYAFRLGELLELAPPAASPRADKVREWWGHGANRQICTVCGVRPMGPAPKPIDRKVCDTCEKRRQERCLQWLENPVSTIWLDEVADRHGRMALVTARFRLGGWLRDGGYIEKSLFLNYERGMNKAPSFARLGRVWETTSEFWRSGLEAIKGAIPARVGRLKVRLKAPVRDVSKGHAYYLESNGYRFSVVCSDGPGRELVIAENLETACRVLNLDAKEGAIEAIRRRFADFPTGQVEEPTGYGSANRDLGVYEIEEVKVSEQAYIPFVEILRDPGMVMFLVPARNATEALELLIDKYGTEMGKVRDRLGLDAGIAYAPVSTPLHALISAGRRMMDRRVEPESWKIAETGRQGSVATLTFENGVNWEVDFSSAHGVEDDWHPFLLRVSSGESKYVHVKELADGDEVQVEPSTLDWEFLETAQRRFEVGYGSDGKRLGKDRPRRPYYLEEYLKLAKLWECLRGEDNDGVVRLAGAQVRTLDGLLAAKRGDWGGQLDERFAENVVANLTWKGRAPAVEDQLKLAEAAHSGMLEDAIELFLSVEKGLEEYEDAPVVGG